MKKHGKLILTIGWVVLIVSLFLNLSLSDVTRLNPLLEGVAAGKLAATARETRVDQQLDVLVRTEGVPENPEATEATQSWSQEGLEAIDADNDGTAETYILDYEKFAAFGGAFAKDKFGAPKTTDVEGVAYYQGKISSSGILWDEMNGWAHFLCILAPVYLPLIIIGAVLIVLGWVLKTQQECDKQGITFGHRLGEIFAPKKILKLISDNAIVVGIILLAVVVSIFRPNFLSEANFRNLLSNTAVRFIIAVGVSVNTDQGYELEAIAGCTIGGVSVNGGVGKISGILIGVLVFELLKIALQFMGVESSYTYIAQGLVIIIAVALDLRKYLAKK